MRLWHSVLACLTSALWLAAVSPAAEPPHLSVKAPRGERVSHSLTRLAHYFGARGSAIEELDVIMVVSLLQRHFDVGAGLLPLTDFYRDQPRLREKQFQLYDLFFDDRRLPDKPLEQILADLKRSYPDNIDGFTDWSMYCPTFPLPADFLSVLRGKIDGGNRYWLTHAGLQIRNALINRCLEGGPEVDSLAKEVAARLRAVVDAGTDSDDVRIEALAILYYLDRADLVRAADIDWVLSRQLIDGGWQSRNGVGRSHNHTSMLALWVLLESRARTPDL